MNAKIAWPLYTLGLIGAALLIPTVGIPQPASSKAAFLRGTVMATVPTQKERLKQIALPHARVFLVRPNALDNPIASALSDLSGRFLIKSRQTGTFVLCVEADGFRRTCDKKQFTLTTSAFAYGNLQIPAPTDSDLHANAYGTVTLQDGERPRAFEPANDINAYPTIELRTKGGTLYKGYVNNFGEYIVPRIPIKEEFVLRVAIDKEVLERQFRGPQALAQLAARRAYPFNFLLLNSTPRIRIVTAMNGGKPVQVAAPGTEIVLHAVSDDPNGDKLEYRWLLPDGKAVGPTGDPSLKWKVPARGNHAFTVIASDLRGGYKRNTIVVRAGDANVPFSGTVVDTNGQPIGSAQVDINGRLVNTNARGWFNFNVPVQDKYVVTIRKPGTVAVNQPAYGTGSFVYTSSITGGRWVLRRAEVFTVDPTKPIVLQQKRDSRDCIGMAASRLDWSAILKPELFQWQDGQGNVRGLADVGVSDPKSVEGVLRMLAHVHPSLVKPMADATKAKVRTDQGRVPCTPGIAVEIPANSLINPATSLPPTGNVQVALSTVDLNTPGQMPGDYTVVEGSGQLFSMESFGAGSVEIGSGANRFNLKPGAVATVTIPVDGTQLAGGAAMPAKIPFLYYDERDGVWRPDGDANLVGAGASAAYVKQVKHFSAMNADIQKQGESCVAVEVDQAALTLPFKAEVVMQPSLVNPGVLQVRELDVNSPNNVIYNLPNQSNIVVTPIIDGVLPDGTAGKVPAGVFVVNTGGPQTTLTKPPTPNADGSYYAESGGVPTGPCGARLTLTNLSPVSIVAPNEYLQGLFFQSTNIDEFTGTGIDTAIDQGSIDYYSHADPLNLRDSFNKFKTKNRFGEPLAAGEVEWDAQYANSGDLGFGRDMHCRRNAAEAGQFDYACYVTNYGQPPANIADQQDAENVVTPGVVPDATVAMEYSRVELNDPINFPTNDRAVKFYVYNTNAPDDPPLRKADLDGHGNRPVPQLCMVCHGGNLASEAADPGNPGGPKKGSFASRQDILDMQSNFLPFDLHYFKFPAGESLANPVTQDKFKKLNIDIVRGVSVATGAAGAAIVDTIDNSLYFGGSATQLNNKVVPGWDTGNNNSPPNRFYRDGFARACRTCHITRPFGAPSFATRLDFEGQISTVQDYVCRLKVMPHAQRTNDIFWTSLNPNMAAYLQLYAQPLPGWTPLPDYQCGQQFQGGGIPPTIFATQIYPILFPNCNGCHFAAGLANFYVDGNLANTYNQLFNNTNDNATQYIVPNSTANSRIYQRITTGNQVTPPFRMPQGGPDLVATDTDAPPDGVFDAVEIGTWINSGAPGP